MVSSHGQFKVALSIQVFFSGGQSVIGAENAGDCSGGLEKGTLDRSGRGGEGAGKANV
jgi:hypothetical protein